MPDGSPGGSKLATIYGWARSSDSRPTIGICLLLGQGWANVAVIVVAGISALINFTWLPYSPFWAILVIAVDLLIIRVARPPGLVHAPCRLPHHRAR